MVLGRPILLSPMSNDAEFDSLSLSGQTSLLDIVDHVLNTGVVVHGSVVISLAGGDLVDLGINVILTSVETALKNLDRKDSKLERPWEKCSRIAVFCIILRFLSQSPGLTARRCGNWLKENCAYCGRR